MCIYVLVQFILIININACGYIYIYSTYLYNNGNSELHKITGI